MPALAVNAADALFDAHLGRAQVEVAGAEELREREGRQRGGVARRQQHVILADLDRRAGALEPPEGVEQARQAHHRAGDEAGRAAEEVEDQPAAWRSSRPPG